VVEYRPLNSREQAASESEVVKCHEKKNAIEVALKTNKNFNKTFWFDNVFGQNASQRDIYVNAITPIGSYRAKKKKNPLRPFLAAWKTCIHASRH
jgi:hypothetical protein